MYYSVNTWLARMVAPFTGAWIEITWLARMTLIIVAPFTGAWIEIMIRWLTGLLVTRRTLHGCVD